MGHDAPERTAADEAAFARRSRRILKRAAATGLAVELRPTAAAAAHDPPLPPSHAWLLRHLGAGLVMDSCLPETSQLRQTCCR